MKKPLEILSNQLYRNEMKLLFGEDYKIKIDHLIKTSKNHNYVVHVKLFIEDPLIISENYTGINKIVDDDIYYYVKKCCEFMGINEEIVVISTIDII